MSAAPRWLRAGLALLILIGMAFVLAHAALDRYLRAEAGVALDRIGRGESRFAFEFERARDLISETAEGVRADHIDQGVWRATLPDGRANVRLNLRGLWLDARRFDFLLTRIHSSAAGELVLIFDEPGQLQQNAVRLDVSAGWNDLQLPLAEMPWRSLAETDTDLVFVSQPWGGRSGAVGEFRLYFALPPGSEIGLDYLRFVERAVATGQTPVHRPWARMEWISVDEARTRLAAQRPLRGSPEVRVGILLPLYRDTPERLLDLRDAALRRDAETLFWPAYAKPPGQDTRYPSMTTGATPSWWMLGLWALILLLLRWRLPVERRGGQLLDLCVGWGPLLGLVVLLALPETPGAPLLVLIGLQLAYLLSRVRLAPWRLVGDAAAWSQALSITVIGILALVFAAYASDFLRWPGGQRLGQYLPFVAIQQILLLGYLRPAIERLWPSGARWLAAALFGALHAPNFALMLLSGLGAWIWLGQYTRTRALLPVMATHYVLGLAAITCLPPWLLYSAEASLRYYTVQ